jgi:hypothetical protein
VVKANTGMAQNESTGYLFHAFAANLRFEPDEFTSSRSAATAARPTHSGSATRFESPSPSRLSRWPDETGSYLRKRRSRPAGAGRLRRRRASSPVCRGSHGDRSRRRPTAAGLSRSGAPVAPRTASAAAHRFLLADLAHHAGGLPAARHADPCVRLHEQKPRRAGAAPHPVVAGPNEPPMTTVSFGTRAHETAVTSFAPSLAIPPAS